MKPRICVYTIALNEIANVESFVASCRDADLILVADTGSTDGTAERLAELDVTVHKITQTPWRFDHARNQSLDLVPNDIDLCVSIDLDERLEPGWRDLIEQHWTPAVTRIKYDYQWSETSRFLASKMHSRQGYRWQYPCHEVLTWTGTKPEQTITIEDLRVTHHADNTKPRTSYLGLLKLGRDEQPNDERMCHYYARELMFQGFYEEAIEEFERHLKIAYWHEERAASLRYISQCYRTLHRHTEALDAAIRSTLECSTSRETWMEVAHSAYQLKDWATLYWCCLKALEITEPTASYKTDAVNWGSLPWDFAALAAYNLNLGAEAVRLGEQALLLDPNNERLRINIEYYTKRIVL